MSPENFTTDQLMRLAPVIPVLAVHSVDHAVPLAEALVAGGLPVLEVTLRTPAALEVISAMATVSGAVVGVGTVIRPQQFQQAKDAGARFAVTPGSTPTLLSAARDSGLPTLPGVASASEAIAALEAGFDRLKLFPAEAAGGIPLLKSLHGPLAELAFCPTGGVGPNNMGAYLKLPNVLCVGGSWVAPTDRVQAGDWAGITALAREAVTSGKQG